MRNGLVSYLAWWGPYAVGVLAVVYSAIIRSDKRADAQTPPDTGGVVPLVVVAVLLLTGFVLTGVFTRPAETSWGFATVLLIGGLLTLAAQLYSRRCSGSGYSNASDAFLGVGLALLETAVLRNHFQESPVVYLLVAALGAWFVAAVLYYGRPSLGWIAARSFALATTVIAAASAMGAYRYTKSGAGSLFAIDACAVVLLLALVFSIAAAWGRGSIAKLIGAAALFILGAWWLGGLMADLVLNQAEAGLCALVGAATVLVVYLLGVSSGDVHRERPGLIGHSEAGVLAVLVTIACAALSMRWLGGYGVGLAAVGALAALPSAHLLTNVADRTDLGAEIANGGAGVVAALGALTLVRVYAEGTVGAGASMHLFESYVLTGLVLGGLLALMQATLAADSTSRSAVAGASRGLAIVVAGIAVVLAAAYFWRAEAVAGLMLGTAVALFTLIAAGPFFGKRAGAPDLALGLPLFTAVLVPAFLTATINLTRDQKVAVMIWTLAAVGFVVIVTSILRLRRAR